MQTLIPSATIIGVLPATEHTNLERLVIFDGIDSEPASDPDDSPRFPVLRRDSRSLGPRLQLVLDDSAARVGPETRREGPGHVQREGKDMTSWFQSVDVMVLLLALVRGAVRGRVQEVEIVEEERVVVVVRRSISPADLGRSSENESIPVSLVRTSSDLHSEGESLTLTILHGDRSGGSS